MALSGVRSSWLMLARNCDLCRLATSSWALLLDLVEQRAFWIASADWAANVWTSSTVSGEGARPPRQTTRPPMMRSSRSSGKPRSERNPARSTMARERVALVQQRHVLVLDRLGRRDWPRIVPSS